MTVMRKLFVLVLMLTAVCARAANFSYPGASVIAETTEDDAWYILALGSITRSGGEWRPEASERFRGALSRTSYQLPYGHTPEEAHDSFMSSIKNDLQRVLFDCSGRDCGTSNYWANRIFSVKELYGPDGNQRYTAVELKRGAVRSVVAVYSIQRANRRSYIHIDWLTVRDAQNGAEVTASDQLRANQAVVLLQSADGWSADMLNSVADFLGKEKDAQLYVVGHAYGGADLQGMRATARGYAEQVAGELRELGVAADRIQLFGLGPLAPGAHAADRVELIRH